MRILLIGEYSNVHWGLSQGLRTLGHDVTVISDGDLWKNYNRDIDLKRRSLGKWDTLKYICRVRRLVPKLKGYDVVQIINPVFLDLKAERILPYYQQLRRQNQSMFLGAFGMDKYWVKVCRDCKTFRYSDFNLGSRERTSPENEAYIREWLNGPKGELNDIIAKDCDGIITGLCEYDMCYQQYFPGKTRYIPFPIQAGQPERLQGFGKQIDKELHQNGLQPFAQNDKENMERPIHFFIGIQKGRSVYKGTDIMLKALERLKRDYPERVIVEKAESVPFGEYQKMISRSDVLLDQLYSYTPAMNGLLAMSKGIIVVGGGEEEHYKLLGEDELRPIINVLPDEENVYRQMEQVVLHPERIPELKRQSIQYIRRHHDCVKVALQYLDFWNETIRHRTRI